MKHILLLGAGFSRNWGAPLAHEVFDVLLANEAVVGNAYLKRLLWENKAGGGFESALAQVQTDYNRDPSRYVRELDLLQSGVMELFDRINN
jgi:hypothetical protein